MDSFKGKSKHGGMQWTMLDLGDVEAMVIREENVPGGTKHFVITRSGNAYPVNEESFYKLQKRWEREYS